jgi:adenylate kinase family enzyme
MIILIAGASHVGKTALAQNLLEKYGYPYLSIDHLKMGLIRSGNTILSPEDDDELTDEGAKSRDKESGVENNGD